MSLIAKALVLVVVSTIASQPAFAKSAVANEDSTDKSAAPPGVSKHANQKIGMVTATLQDILQSVVNEEAQETTLFNKYTEWCENERGSLRKDVSETKTALANAKVLSEEQLSTIDGLKLFVTHSEKEIEETKDAIAQAVALRTDENGQYTEDMQMNTQSLRQIDTAIKHVGKVQKQGGFLQNGVMKKLQVNQPGESSYVFGIMKGLKDKLQATRASLKKIEQEKVTMHNSFMETKGQSLKALSDTLTEKKISLTETSAKQAGVTRKIGRLTEEVAKLLKSASQTDETCQTSEQEWKVRQADRIKEKAALGEAVRYLKEMSFEQLAAVQHNAESENEDDLVVVAPSFLQTSSDSQANDGDFATAAAAFMGEDSVEDHVQKEAFGGVKGVVSKLITAHKDTQGEETTKKAFCEKEIAAKEDEQADTKNAMDAVTANIAKKKAEVAMLADEIKALYASIDRVKNSLEEAGKLRKQENAIFTAGSKDRTLAIKVLNQAKTVLQNFYDKSSLLQQSASGDAPPPKKWDASSPRKTVGSFGAASMVQDIADDIAKEQKDAAIQEKTAADAFAALQVESQETTDNKQQDITDRVTAKAKTGVQINYLHEEGGEKSNDLNSVGLQLSALHDQCDELLRFYDKRVKARSFEVAQLRDVMDILSGSSISARTGLVQRDDVARQTDEQDDEDGSAAETSEAQ